MLKGWLAWCLCWWVKDTYQTLDMIIQKRKSSQLTPKFLIVSARMKWKNRNKTTMTKTPGTDIRSWLHGSRLLRVSTPLHFLVLCLWSAIPSSLWHCCKGSHYSIFFQIYKDREQGCESAVEHLPYMCETPVLSPTPHNKAERKNIYISHI